MAKNELVIMILGTDPPPVMEEEWNKWYNEKHWPDVLKFKGFKKATRYKLIDDPEGGKYPRYLAIYEMESKKAADDYDNSPIRKAAGADWSETWGKKGAQIIWRAHYAPIASWERK